ncbi:MAG: Inner rane protein YihY, formerly thought to be RNase [Myxococcales bacterium]|nr:Inner rane protein YihY, formerly thought to be RNase [Myxococcales bacterium]
MLGAVRKPAVSKSSAASRLLTLVRHVVRGLFVHHAFDHAATMAFYFFLGTIPLMMMAGLIVGRVLAGAGAENLLAPLYRVLPEVARELVRSEVGDIAAASGASLAPLSLLGFLWLTSNGFHNLMDVFELLIAAKPRVWWRQRVIAMVWVAATLTAALASVALLAAVLGWTAGIRDAGQVPILVRRVRIGPSWQAAGVLLAFVGVMLLGVAAFYRVAVVHPRGVRRRVWPGAIVAMSLWVAVSWTFSAYVHVIGHYAIFYGGLATVAVTLLWFYLSSLSFVIGAEVNAQLEGVRDPPPSVAL